MAKKLKRKKSDRKKLINKLDKICGEIVRNRGYCQRCNKTTNLQCAHIWHRGHKSVRFNFDNLLCLCAGCHKFWAHQEPLIFTEWVKSYLGVVKYENLKKQAQKVWKPVTSDLQDLYDALKKHKEQKEVLIPEDLY